VIEGKGEVRFSAPKGERKGQKRDKDPTDLYLPENSLTVEFEKGNWNSAGMQHPKRMGAKKEGRRTKARGGVFRRKNFSYPQSEEGG